MLHVRTHACACVCTHDLQYDITRGEGSTAWLNDFAARTGREFFSVDFAPEGFENARRVCGPCAYRGLGLCFCVLSVCMCV